MTLDLLDELVSGVLATLAYAAVGTVVLALGYQEADPVFFSGSRPRSDLTIDSFDGSGSGAVEFVDPRLQGVSFRLMGLHILLAGHEVGLLLGVDAGVLLDSAPVAAGKRLLLFVANPLDGAVGLAHLGLPATVQQVGGAAGTALGVALLAVGASGFSGGGGAGAAEAAGTRLAFLASAAVMLVAIVIATMVKRVPSEGPVPVGH